MQKATEKARTFKLFLTTNVSVSYTHLDVYKRQEQRRQLSMELLCSLRVCRVFSDSTFGATSTFSARVYFCLLYTSRCV